MATDEFGITHELPLVAHTPSRAAAVVDLPQSFLAFSPEWLEHFRRRYPLSSLEVRLLEEVRDSVTVRGCLDQEELLRIVRWKSRRALRHASINSRELVSLVSRAAISAPETLAVHTLTYLRGVSVPMASAIMTVINPDRFTIMDVYSTAAISQYVAQCSTVDLRTGDYWSYLLICRRLADQLGTNLRDLDRALWAYGKALEESRQRAR